MHSQSRANVQDDTLTMCLDSTAFFDDLRSRIQGPQSVAKSMQNVQSSLFGMRKQENQRPQELKNYITSTHLEQPHSARNSIAYSEHVAVRAPGTHRRMQTAKSMKSSAWPPASTRASETLLKTIAKNETIA